MKARVIVAGGLLLASAALVVGCTNVVETPTSAPPPPTSPPTPTATPEPPPDVIVSSARLTMRGYTQGCVPTYNPLLAIVCVRNQGAGDAGRFVVRGDFADGQIEWEIMELAAGQERCLEDEVAISQVTVDAGEDLDESDEDNNTFVMPNPTPPPLCTPWPPPPPGQESQPQDSAKPTGG